MNRHSGSRQINLVQSPFFVYFCSMTDRAARNIALCIVASAGLLVASLALWRAFRVREPHADIDRDRYPVAGLDISAHNGIVRFDSVAAAGIDFVYLKASEGVSFRDQNFIRNYDNARKSGLKVGAYHFFRFDCDGAMQSVNFLSAINDRSFALPLAIDVEEWRNAPGQTTDIIRERLTTMMALLQAQGYKIVVYTNKQGHARFVREGLPNGKTPDVWICSFTNQPLAHEPWRLWQHSHIGHIPGVKGAVDLNTFNGSRHQWQRWLDSCAMTERNKQPVQSVD